jgi:hypothetical protein
LAIFDFFKFVFVTNISYRFHFDLFWPCGKNIISYTYHTSTIIIVTVTQVYRFTSRGLSKKSRLRNQRVMFSRCNPFNIFGASTNWRRGIYAFAVDFIYGWFVPGHPRSGSIKTLRHQNFIQDIAPCEYFKFKL